MVSANSNGSKIVVKCTGADAESGISRYKFFVSEKDGEFKLFDEQFEPTATFAIPEGGKYTDYKFYALAIDNVGNMLQEPPTAIAASLTAGGDANDDEIVDVKDIMEITDYLKGKPSGKFKFVNADANSDGQVNVADIIMIVNGLLNVTLSE